MEPNETGVGGDGIAHVTHEGRRVATVRYHLGSWPKVDGARRDESVVDGWTLPRPVDGDIEVLACETSFYSDTLYALELKTKPWGDCVFYAEPVDVVGGRYRIQGTWRRYGSTVNGSLN